MLIIKKVYKLKSKDYIIYKILFASFMADYKTKYKAVSYPPNNFI